MEKKIRIEALQKSFLVSLKDVAKAKRNRSYSNASNCCHAKVEMDKKCSACQTKVDVSEVKTKLVKMGKQMIPVPKEKLDEVMDFLEDMEEIVVKAIIPYNPSFGEEWKEGLMVATNSSLKRKAGQYSELKALLKGRIFVCEGVVRKNQYQMMMYEKDNQLYMRKLVSPDQFYPEVETTDVEVSEKLIEIENQVLSKFQTETYDLSEFNDKRAELESEIIEKYVLGGEDLPKVEVTEQAMEKEAESEIERLQKLLVETE